MTTSKPVAIRFVVPKHAAWDVKTLVSPMLPSEQLMVLAADYEALQAECEKWKRGSEIRDEQNQDLHSFVMELKAERDQLRKDAERLDFIAQHPGWLHSRKGWWGCVNPFTNYSYPMFKTPRDAIDYALSTYREGGES